MNYYQLIHTKLNQRHLKLLHVLYSIEIHTEDSKSNQNFAH